MYHKHFKLLLAHYKFTTFNFAQRIIGIVPRKGIDSIYTDKVYYHDDTEWGDDPCPYCTSLDDIDW